MLQQARRAHKAQHTNMNFVHHVCMHRKASRLCLLGQGAPLLYVCKALSTSAVLAQRAGNYMEEGRFYALAQPFSILLCHTHRGHSSLALRPTGCRALRRVGAASRPALPSSSKAELCSHALSSSG